MVTEVTEGETHVYFHPDRRDPRDCVGRRFKMKVHLGYTEDYVYMRREQAMRTYVRHIKQRLAPRPMSRAETPLSHPTPRDTRPSRFESSVRPESRLAVCGCRASARRVIVTSLRAASNLMFHSCAEATPKYALGAGQGQEGVKTLGALSVSCSRGGRS